MQKLLGRLAFVIALGFEASMARADDRVTWGTANNPVSSTEDDVSKEGRSTNDVGQLVAQVKELRAELRRLTKLLERHLAETDGPADKKAVPPTHELPGPASSCCTSPPHGVSLPNDDSNHRAADAMIGIVDAGHDPAS